MGECALPEGGSDVELVAVEDNDIDGDNDDNEEADDKDDDDSDKDSGTGFGYSSALLLEAAFEGWRMSRRWTGTM